MKSRPSGAMIALAFVCAVALSGCGQGNNENSAASPARTTASGTINPPDVSFARALGISEGPITAEQAGRIAEAATGGVAGEIEQEDEDGVHVFGVDIKAADGDLDVKVRISDGAVTKIEKDDEDDDGGKGDEGHKDDDGDDDSGKH